MTLDEAIKHAEEVVDGHSRIKQIKAVTLEECKRAEEYRQLAEWLKELKQLREQTSWIPDTRVTIKEAAEELQNLAKAGISQEPCDTCGYEEGSIYCKEHCPHEVKIEQEPCSTISKQAVNTLIDELERAICDERGCISRGRSTASIMQDIRNLPPVTPQPKTGRWVAYEVRLPDRTILNYRCSVCGRKLIGYSTETLSEAPFCHCGAKMVEPQERSDKE